MGHSKLVVVFTLVLQVTSSRNERIRSIIAIKFQSYRGQKKNTPLTSYEWFEALNENSVDVGKKEMQRFFCRLQENCTMSLQWRLRPTQLELKMFSDQNKRVVEKVLTSCTTNNIQHHRHRIKNMHFAIFASSRFFLFIFDAIIGLHSSHFFPSRNSLFQLIRLFAFFQLWDSLNFEYQRFYQIKNAI